MARARRRTPQPEPVEITAERALEYEITRTWPPGERARWWSRPEVPAVLRQTARPDPRAVLQDDELVRLNYHNDLDAWRERRLTWLERQADG